MATKKKPTKQQVHERRQRIGELNRQKLTKYYERLERAGIEQEAIWEEWKRNNAGIYNYPLRTFAPPLQSQPKGE